MIALDLADYQCSENLPAAPSAVDDIRKELDEMKRLILAQNAMIQELTQITALLRISRSQEKAIQEAVRGRAQMMTESYGLPPRCMRLVANLIRKSVTDATGARAMGDIRASEFTSALRLVTEWEMPGALRRMRRENNGLYSQT